MSLLSVKDVCKAFGKNEVLQGITFEVRQGEVLSIIGPSGSGKSTLLRCLTLLERVDTGCIAYEDLTMVSMAAGERANRCVYSPGPVLQQIRRRFGLVFQNFNLFPHMSVMQPLSGWLGEARTRPAGRRRPCSRRWGFPTRRTRIPASCPAGSSSGWPLPGRWPCIRISCFSMNPPPPWIPS